MMRRGHHRWYSSELRRDMELLVFGYAGTPMIVFPTSTGAFYDYEDRGMVAAIAGKIDAGVVQLFTVATLDGETFYGRHLPPRTRIDRYLQWERYLMREVVPFVRRTNGSETMGATGCSFGGYHALTMALRHPDVLTTCITMGGAFDIESFLGGYYDADVYLLCPPHFLPNLADAWYLDRIRRNKWVLATGERDGCREANERLSAMFTAKQIPHSLHVWGDGSVHDWPEWRKMARAYIP
jgi:esterase/lipase superfamily enzyme